jgi:endonuclease/exonuclease/phosphatase (EEP) superfamily protein YafD
VVHPSLRTVIRLAVLPLVVTAATPAVAPAPRTWAAVPVLVAARPDFPEPVAVPVARRASEEYRVMSFNVCGGACRAGEVHRTAAFAARTALRHRASAVLLQELCFGQYREIRSLLAGHGYTGRFATTTRSRACGGAYGVAMLVRGRSAGTVIRRLPVRAGHEPRVLLGTHLRIAGRRTLVAVVHLSPSTQAGLAGQLRTVAGLLDGPVIIGGDFNALPASPGLQPFYARCVEADPTRRTPTFDLASRKIDYIFGSAALVSRAASRSLPTAMSDHRVYLGTLEVSPL